MTYDPFARGAHPVGVRSHTLTRDGRTVPVEVWYPADERHRGADLDGGSPDRFAIVPGAPTGTQAAVRDARPADIATAGTAPAVIFSHGFSGHRRQSTHLTTHLASHGYVVAAPDHTGNTTPDVMGWALGVGTPTDMAAYIRTSAADRLGDVGQTLDALLAGELGIAADPASCGIAGHSFGGWTALTAPAGDPRLAAVLPLAPAGGDGGVPTGPTDPRVVMNEMLDLDWGRPVPTLTIVADGDTVLPYPMMTDLLGRAPVIERLVVVVNGDHYHFCDNVEAVHDLMTAMMGEGAKPSSELVPGEQAQTVTTGLGLAHFDASLRGVADASALLEDDLVAVLAARGVVIDVVTGR